MIEHAAFIAVLIFRTEKLQLLFQILFNILLDFFLELYTGAGIPCSTDLVAATVLHPCRQHDEYHCTTHAAGLIVFDPNALDLFCECRGTIIL